MHLKVQSPQGYLLGPVEIALDEAQNGTGSLTQPSRAPAT